MAGSEGGQERQDEPEGAQHQPWAGEMCRGTRLDYSVRVFAVGGPARWLVPCHQASPLAGVRGGFNARLSSAGCVGVDELCGLG